MLFLDLLHFDILYLFYGFYTHSWVLFCNYNLLRRAIHNLQVDYLHPHHHRLHLLKH